MSKELNEVLIVQEKIELLDVDSKLTVKDIAIKLNEVIEKINDVKVRDRGPKSVRKMTEEDAIRVIEGDLKDVPHKEVAEQLGLSYGQVYSARFGFTFKEIYRRNYLKQTKRA